MIKCKDRIIPNADVMDIMSIIMAIRMDLDEIRKNPLVNPNNISIYLSRNIILHLASNYYIWKHCGYLKLDYGVDWIERNGIFNSMEVDGQLFGCDIHILYPWSTVDLEDAYRIQFEEVTFIPLNPGASSLDKLRDYIDTDNSDELHWSVYDNSLGGKSMINASKICKGITNRIYGSTLMSQKEIDYVLEDNKAVMECYNAVFNRFFDSGDALLKHIKSVIINKKKGVTTVTWDDGDVTMVRPMPGVEWDDQQAIDECIMKKLFKTNSHHKKAVGKVIAKARVIEDKPEEPKEEHNNYIQEAISDYINGKTEE